jgi:hypothetical protein
MNKNPDTLFITKESLRLVIEDILRNERFVSHTTDYQYYADNDMRILGMNIEISEGVCYVGTQMAYCSLCGKKINKWKGTMCSNCVKVPVKEIKKNNKRRIILD